MKQFISNLLVLGILWSLTVMSACTHNNDSGILELADGETLITLTPTGVGESEDSAVRGTEPESLEVTSQSIGNGLSLQTCITRDNSAQTRGGNALATGSKFLVYVYQKAPKEASYTLRSWDPQIELTVGSQTPQTFALRQGFEYTLVCVAYLGNGGKSYAPVVAADQTINVTDFSKDYIKQNIYVDLRTDPATSKTVNFAFNHCLTKLTLEIDTSQMTGVYMKKNTAITYASTYVKIPLSPDKSTYDYSGRTDKQVDLGYDNNSNSQSVVVRTEVFLADPDPERAKIDIVELYLTNNPTVNILKETYTLQFNKLLSPGKSYKAKVSVDKAGGVVVGNLIWATGNLYKAEDGTYKFHDAQEKYYWPTKKGDMFAWNTLEPDTRRSYILQTTMSWIQDNDPCKRVRSYGGGWRTPTVSDIYNLQKDPPRDGTLHQLNGVPGIFFANKKIFLPQVVSIRISTGTKGVPMYATASDYVYSSDITGYIWLWHYIYKDGTPFQMHTMYSIYTPEFMETCFPVRCCKDKP